MYGREDCRVIADRTYLMKTYRSVFVGSEFVSWLLEKGDVGTRIEGIQLGQNMLDTAFISHVVDEHEFKDKVLYYRFVCDEKTRRYGAPRTEDLFVVSSKVLVVLFFYSL